MTDSTISVAFDREDATFYAGEVVRGTITLTLVKQNCRAVRAVLGWQTHGHGRELHRVVETRPISDALLEAGVHTLPFEIALPVSEPYTYHGHYLNVDWYVEGVADVSWASDPKGRADLVLLPSREARPDSLAPPAPAEASSQGRWPIVIGALIIAASIILSVYGLQDHDHKFVFLITPLGLIIGAVTLYRGVHRFLATRLIERVAFDVDPWPAHPDSALTHTITLTPRRTIMVNAITATLIGKEEVRLPVTSGTVTYKHVLYEEEIELMGSGTLTGGQEVSLKAAFTLPDEPLYTFKARDNALFWTLTTRIDIPNWPDWEDTRTIIVTPDLDRAGAPADREPPTPRKKQTPRKKPKRRR